MVALGGQWVRGKQVYSKKISGILHWHAINAFLEKSNFSSLWNKATAAVAGIFTKPKVISVKIQSSFFWHLVPLEVWTTKRNGKKFLIWMSYCWTFHYHLRIVISWYSYKSLRCLECSNLVQKLPKSDWKQDSCNAGTRKTSILMVKVVKKLGPRIRFLKHWKKFLKEKFII